jgi:hypothetical protein
MIDTSDALHRCSVLLLQRHPARLAGRRVRQDPVECGRRHAAGLLEIADQRDYPPRDATDLL